MRSLLLSLLLLPSLCFAGPVLFITDSIGYKWDDGSGYIPYVQQTLPCVTHIPVNAWDTDTVIANLPEWLAGQSPSIIYWNVGLHDAEQNPAETPDQYGQNLATIANMMYALDPGVIIVFGLSTPIPAAINGPPYFPEPISTYNGEARTWLIPYGVQIDALSLLMVPYNDTDHMGMPDIQTNAHWDTFGQQLMASHIIDTLQALGACQ